MELDGALAGPSDLVDAMGNLRIADVSLIGGIVEDQGVVLQSVVHPLAQFLFGDNRTRGVVGVTQVDHVHMAVLGDAGREAVLRRTGHIDHIGPATVLEGTATSDHHIRVDIDRIDGIGDADEVVPVQQFLDVTCV